MTSVRDCTTYIQYRVSVVKKTPIMRESNPAALDFWLAIHCTHDSTDSHFKLLEQGCLKSYSLINVCHSWSCDITQLLLRHHQDCQHTKRVRFRGTTDLLYEKTEEEEMESQRRPWQFLCMVPNNALNIKLLNNYEFPHL